MSRINNIQDDEVRIVGSKRQVSTPPDYSPSPSPSPSGKKWIWYLIALAAFIALASFVFVIRAIKTRQDNQVEGVFEQIEPIEAAVESQPTHFLIQEDTLCYTELRDTVINDVQLSIFIPHNASPILTVGAPDNQTRKAILGCQAADIRQDNKQILGVFILKGKLLGKGSARTGYCAIIDDKLSIGVSESTPLFEQAIDSEGYFFRQFALVDNRTIVEGGPKNKSRRKALCSIDNKIVVIMSQTDESFHDFSEALIDLGVDTAISLVGGYAFAWYRDKDDNLIQIGIDEHKYRNESYIVWTAK